MQDPGWSKQSEVQRYTFNANASYDLSKTLRVKILTSDSYRKQKAPGTLSQDVDVVSGEVKRGFDINPYSYALNTSRTTDPNATLAHELGHYLGLFHSFSEKTVKDKSEAADDDDDSDYCDDTPSYNRIAYGKWLTEYVSKAQAIKKDTTLSMRELAKRTNSKDEEWQSDNLMDYSICYSMRFTPEQANRIRQVLYYSPLIPGPKKVRPRTRAWDEMPETEDDLPIRYAKEKAVSIKDIRILKAEK